MKKIASTLLILVLLLFAGLYAKRKLYIPKQSLKIAEKYDVKEGDIVFQTTSGDLSEAIRLATHSPYCHCGIVFKYNTGYFVEEALEPVRMTPLNEWLGRGIDGHFSIKRLKNAGRILTSSTLEKMKQTGARYLNKHYDVYFEWSDDKIYCSELVWKIYNTGAGIKVGKLEKLKDFDLTSDMVKKEMKQRYGYNIPYNETVISPSDIYMSDVLMTVVTR